MAIRFINWLIACCMWGVAAVALGEEVVFTDDHISAINTFWVVMASILVFMMQMGFAQFEIGSHALKNSINVFMKNIVDFVIASLCFYGIGFGLMFGDGNTFFGTEGFFLSGNFASLDWADIPLNAKFFFQLVFAGTAATIISGAIGGRVKFLSYVALSALVTAFVYPVLGHWVWGGGWLAERGFIDFAGSTVVHGVGGVAALAAAMIAGPRIGRFGGPDAHHYNGSSDLRLVGSGTLVLWIGWFGFNAGSTMAVIGNQQLISHIILTTNLSAACGALFALIAGWLHDKHADLGMTLNGVLAGLVGITASCAFVTPLGAAVTGSISGILVFYSIRILERMQIDDAVGAFPVHGVCGIWGTIATGLFASAPWAGGPGGGAVPGLFYGGGFSQLWVQTYGVLAVSTVTFAVIYGGGLFMRRVFGVRVTRKRNLPDSTMLNMDCIKNLNSSRIIRAEHTQCGKNPPTSQSNCFQGTVAL